MLSYRFWLHCQYLLQILVQSDVWENVRTLTGFDVELINFGSTMEPLVYKYLAQWPTALVCPKFSFRQSQNDHHEPRFRWGTIDWAWLRHETRRMRNRRSAYGETRPGGMMYILPAHDRWVLGWICIIGCKWLCDLIEDLMWVFVQWCTRTGAGHIPQSPTASGPGIDLKSCHNHEFSEDDSFVPAVPPTEEPIQIR